MIIQNSLKLLHELSHLEKKIGELEQIISRSDAEVDIDLLLNLIITQQLNNND